MSWKKIFAVIRREYLERVRTKAFWIATFLVPIFFLGYMAVQFQAIKKTSGERKIAVVDVTGRLAPALGPLDRTTELLGRETGQNLVVVDIELAAKPPANLGGNHVDRVGSEAEGLGDRSRKRMRNLAR